MSNTKTWEPSQPKQDMLSVTNCPFKMGQCVKNLFEEKKKTNIVTHKD